MWFNSYEFWLFLAAVLAVYGLLREHRTRNIWLLLTSCYFYACYDWRFLGLIFFCVLINYQAALKIDAAHSSQGKKAWLAVALIGSLGVLAWFKYCNFFMHELSRALTALNLAHWEPTFRVILPAGISFFTFQALSYTIDVFRGKTRVESDFLNFALYITFFPPLVAGPIERSQNLMPQVCLPRPKINEKRFHQGLLLVASGLFLKVVMADNLAAYVGYVFDAPAKSFSAPEVLMATYAFSFQIYGDFAGYSAIACGVSKWLGFDLMLNFKQPYFATGPSDFWARWHISLSSWLRDYLYIPLGGNRGGRWFTYRNLFLTMLLGGLWHGAAWHFVLWGAFHGLWLILARILGLNTRSGDSQQGSFVMKALSIFITFHLVAFGWLLFRADNWAQIIEMLQTLMSDDWKWTAYCSTTAFMLFFFACPWMLYESWRERQGSVEPLMQVHWVWNCIFYIWIVAMMMFFPPTVPAEFIYFRF